MLDQLYELAKRLFGMTRDIPANTAGIKKLENQVEILSEAVRGFTFELRSLRETEALEREKQMLRLENAVLHAERRLLTTAEPERTLPTDNVNR